ncbi:uncharacterized protein LOC133511453 isoform X2 [Syngnathoides biaculeatus]|uniref:uncharacterized protein LOC133511453 isoform X2 n=1 Tax=Syngnathoides biaculeatus TaxID=300417 RepID=UPI002ADDC134|nr:uncharacterized protein LOC133511453 isoform X2 [Syngnathoides biaculeatus]
MDCNELVCAPTNNMVPKTKTAEKTQKAAKLYEGYQRRTVERTAFLEEASSSHADEGSKSDDPLSPDFIPSVFKHTKSPRKRKAISAVETFQRRNNTKERHARERSRQEAAVSLLNLNASVSSENNPFNFPDDEETGTETQTDLTSHSIDAMITECQQLRSENMKLKSAQQKYLFDIASLQGSDKKVKQYTGIASYTVLMEVFQITEPFLKDKSLSKSQQFMMTLLRLRFNLSYVLLSYIYGPDALTLSIIFLDVINVMNCKLVPALVFWPDKDQVHLSMPMCFRLANYSKCISIIDWFEICLERPSDLKARAQSPYSNSKSHNTVKYLISITAQGFISFVSKGWGGRTSDKYVTEQSGFLNFLLPGDVVLADRGFDIKDSLAAHGATLDIPAFTKGKTQLDPSELGKNREIDNVRIHVERVIGMLKQKYSILESTIPIEYMKKFGCHTTLDRIVRVASALCNVSTPIVPSD